MAVVPSYYCSGHLPAQQQHETQGERCWQIFLGVLFPNKDMCAYSVKVFFVPLSLKPWILFLWFPLKYCKICIWHWVATAHTSLSQHEPAQEFVISAYSRTVLQTISSYFGVDPVCWKLPSKEMTLAKKEAETGLQIHLSVEEVLLAMFVDAQATGM